MMMQGQRQPLPAPLGAQELKSCQIGPLFVQNSQPLYPHLSHYSWIRSPWARWLSAAEATAKELTAAGVCPQHSLQQGKESFPPRRRIGSTSPRLPRLPSFTSIEALLLFCGFMPLYLFLLLEMPFAYCLLPLI